MRYSESYFLIFSLQMPLQEALWTNTWRSKRSCDISLILFLSAEVHQTDSDTFYSGKSLIRLKFMFQPSYWRSYNSRTSVIKQDIFCISVVSRILCPPFSYKFALLVSLYKLYEMRLDQRFKISLVQTYMFAIDATVCNVNYSFFDRRENFGK